MNVGRAGIGVRVGEHQSAGTGLHETCRASHHSRDGVGTDRRDGMPACECQDIGSCQIIAGHTIGKLNLGQGLGRIHHDRCRGVGSGQLVAEQHGPAAGGGSQSPVASNTEVTATIDVPLVDDRTGDQLSQEEVVNARWRCGRVVEGETNILQDADGLGNRDRRTAGLLRYSVDLEVGGKAAAVAGRVEDDRQGVRNSVSNSIVVVGDAACRAWSAE